MPPKIKVKYLSGIKKPWSVNYAAVKNDKFGDIQIGALNGVICFLYFAPPSQLKSHVEILRKRFEDATFLENSTQMEALAEKIFSMEYNDEEIEVLLHGTDFQNIVWESLLKIPKGDQWTYGDCAELMGKPSAVRAVANAVGSNEVAYLIPCHRVVSKNGNKFKYRWGAERKKQILEYEAGN